MSTSQWYNNSYVMLHILVYGINSYTLHIELWLAPWACQNTARFIKIVILYCTTLNIILTCPMVLLKIYRYCMSHKKLVMAATLPNPEDMKNTSFLPCQISQRTVKLTYTFLFVRPAHFFPTITATHTEGNNGSTTGCCQPTSYFCVFVLHPGLSCSLLSIKD